MNLSIIPILMLSLVETCWSLECFACDRQDGNRDKCIKTTKQCTEDQDACITRIRWGIPPYWTPRGDRIHFINKDCHHYSECVQEREKAIMTCKRDWYDDWACVECCSGDLCNYYVTLGAGELKPMLMLPLLVTGIAMLHRLLL